MTVSNRCAARRAPAGCLIRVAVLALLAAPSCMAAASTLWGGKVGPFYGRVILWNAAELNRESLQLYYEQLSQELRGNLAWTVSVFVDQDDATREVSGKLKVENLDYAWWLELYRKFGRNLLAAAEILCYQDNAVLRLRDSTGKVTESVLAGSNFLHVQLDRVQFEILKAYYGPLPPHTSSAPGDEAAVHIYVRASSAPISGEAREFSRLMQERYKQKRVTVLIRTDAFFLTDWVFPIMYRFDAATTPPTREEYEKSKTIYCFCDQPSLPCR